MKTSPLWCQNSHKAFARKAYSTAVPIIFVDESQDTLPEVVACLKHISQRIRKTFASVFSAIRCKRSTSAASGTLTSKRIGRRSRSQRIFDHPNESSMSSTLSVKTEIICTKCLASRRSVQRPGEVAFFVLPADETRTATLLSARKWLAVHSRIGAWVPHDGHGETKVLVIAHRMAARRLAFEKLYETFHSSHTFSDAFDEGRAWPIAPFLNTLIPLVKAADSERARLVPLLRANSPLLRDGSLGAANTRDRLRSLAAGVEQLAAIVRFGGNASVEKALRAANEAQLLELDERLAGFFTEDERPKFLRSRRTMLWKRFVNSSHATFTRSKGTLSILTGSHPIRHIKASRGPSIRTSSLCSMTRKGGITNSLMIAC